MDEIVQLGNLKWRRRKASFWLRLLISLMLTLAMHAVGGS
jgi:hypothetical protein